MICLTTKAAPTLLAATAHLPLRNRAGAVVAWATIDADLLPWASQWRWSLTAAGYVRRGTVAGEFLLHREILALKHGDPRQGDHRNGNPLDNRRENLRVATHGQNQQNRRGGNRGALSGHRGVAFNARRGKWIAYADVDGKRRYVGCAFATEDEAAAAVAQFRREYLPFSEMDRA